MIADLAAGAVAMAFLVLPGTVLARRRRLPQPLVAGFIAGAVALVLLVLLPGAAGLPLGRWTLLAGWVGVTLLALGLDRHAPAPPDSRTVEPAPPLPRAALRWLPLVPALAVVAYRAVAQPLFGADTVFRWNFLAEQMVRHGTLAFYPPVTAGDYALYGWPDAIPPLVSTLYFWTYQLRGAIHPVATAPLVVLQFILLALVVQALAKHLFSERAAALAGALLAGTPLVLWSTAMGQETGLTALAVTGLLLYLPSSREEETTAAVIVAALAASLGALAREYGLVFPVLGLVIGWSRGLSARRLLWFALVAGATVAPWYLRNWMHTGNPLFNQDLAGWFPTNDAHARLMRIYQHELGWRHLPPEAPRVFVTNCFAGIAGALVGALWMFRRGGALLLAIAVCAGLCALSLPYTAAGYLYAMRVLNPALALGAVLGGAAIARWWPGQRHRAGLYAALALLAIDSAVRALVLPANPYRVPPRDWLRVGAALQSYHARPVYAQVARLVGQNRLLVLGPQALMTELGVTAIPPWSPEVAYLFDDKASPGDIARRLDAGQIRFALLVKDGLNWQYLAASPLFRDPGRILRVVLDAEDMVLVRIVPASPTAP